MNTEKLETISPEAIQHLQEIVSEKNNNEIAVTAKTDSDILMQALCRAVSDSVIKPESVSPKIAKLLNSTTGSLSESKLNDLLTHIRHHQKNMCCVITLSKPDMSPVKSWCFNTLETSATFISIFDYVINEFGITPSIVRTKMVDTLKPTIVNNISQLVSRYIKRVDVEHINVSIKTISRLVNMENHLFNAEFKEL